MNRSKYERRILRLLARVEQIPLDVEKIRRECHIGNWQTALKHCLELLYDGQIQGMKSSKGWLFWANKSPQQTRSLKPPKMQARGLRPEKTAQEVNR